MEAGRISTGMTEKKRTLLDINPADRARLLASATAYAAGRRTYVVGAVSDVIAANAGRLDAAAREALADAIRPAADAGDSIDAPAWTRALAALETAAPDDLDGLDGSPVDLRILLFCAFRHDMGDDAGLWTRLLDDPPEEIDGQWRAISARDLYEAGYAPQGAPEPPIQHLEPLGDAGDPAWADVYMALVGGGR